MATWFAETCRVQSVNKLNSLCAFVGTINVCIRISHVSYTATICLPGFHKTNSRQHNITEIKLH